LLIAFSDMYSSDIFMLIYFSYWLMSRDLVVLSLTPSNMC